MLRPLIKIPSVGDRLSRLAVSNHCTGKKSVPYGWNLFRSDYESKWEKLTGDNTQKDDEKIEEVMKN
jgi:hypothetical protein